MIEKRYTLADLVLTFPADKAEETVLVCLDAAGIEINRLTFDSLRSSCLHMAGQLAINHVPGTVMLLAADDTAAFTTAFFGCILAGLVPAPLPPCKNKHDKAGWQRLRQLAENGTARQILVPESQVQLYNACCSLSVISIDRIREATAAPAELPVLQPGSLAYLQYTSGSTAQPRGVALTHQNVLSNLQQMYRVFNRHATVRVAGWIPLHHDMGLVGHLMTVLYESGFGVLMPPAAFLSNPAVWLRAISHYTCNSAAAPTFAFEYCCRKATLEPGTNLSCWKYAYTGSETVTPEILSRFAEKFAPNGFDSNAFKPVYGLAEATVLVAGGGKGVDELNSECITRETGQGINRVLVPYLLDADTKVTIQDPESSMPCADGVAGEICISGAGCSAGYYGETVKHSIVRTGDLGFIRNNYLYITGRLKDLIIIRGTNYAAEDLEICCRHEQPLLQTHDATICTALPDAQGESLLVLQEVQRHMSAVDQQAVKKIIQANLSSSIGIVPGSIVLVPTGCLPRTRNNKLARQAALNAYLSNSLTTLTQAPAANILPAQTGDDPVVVVGMACRFPGGADSPEKFWELLSAGCDAISEVPADRWDNQLFYDPRQAVPGKLSTRWAGFINDVDQFDPILFGITSFEAKEIDPQQRLLLETSWRLLENTGWRKDQLEGSDTGVFVGISTNDYLYMKIKLLQGMESFNAYSGLGNANSIAANRLSYCYDLRGPSMAVDTACSSSLTALHLAATAILNNECTQAIAGGVNVILSPGPTITLSQFGMMSPVGRCQTFDASADGYVRSEGCGLVMLKRRSAAIRDNDTILATLRATACAQDGHSQGITFPNGAAQQQLLRKALRTAGIEPSTVTCVEAHGTGTAAGDPVEMEQIRTVYGTAGKQPCYVSAVKASIGHLEAAAGIASFIKALLMLQHKAIPPQLHLRHLNPAIRLKDSRLQIATELTQWETGSSPRRMGISSFGFGGALAHVILEESNPAVMAAGSTTLPYNCFLPLPLSAPSPEALYALVQQWHNWLQQQPDKILAAACYTQAMHHTHFRYRHCLLAGSVRSMTDKAAQLLETGISIQPTPANGKICFLFTGQGEHYLHMGSALYRRFPVFTAAFDRCAAALNEQLPGISLQHFAFESTNTAAWKDSVMQPILFAVQYALAMLWQSCGCIPDMVIGHSLGEYAAACIAGCFEPETGMLLLYKRGLLVEGLAQRGMMATIFTTAAEVAAEMDSAKVQIAVINSNKKTVVAGDALEVERLMSHFEAAGISTYRLKTDVAFHSHLMDPVLGEYESFLKTFSFQPPVKTWISGSTGSPVETAPGAAHWITHMRHTIRFSEAVNCIAHEPLMAFIEIGPGSSSLVAARENLPDTKALLLRSLNIKKGDRTEDYFFLDAVAQCYQAGKQIQWQPLLSANHIPVPGMPFMHERCWADGLTPENLASFSQSNGKAAIQVKAAASLNSKVPIHHNISWIHRGTLNTGNWQQQLQEDTSWIITGTASTLSATLVQQLKAHTRSVYWFALGGDEALKPDYYLPADAPLETVSKGLAEIVLLRSRENTQRWKTLFVCDDPGSFEQTGSLSVLEQVVKDTTGSLITLLKACRETSLVAPLWVITQHSQWVAAAAGTAALQLSMAPVWGFGKTIFLEHPEWRGGLIDADAAAPVNERAAAILAKVTGQSGEAAVAIRNGEQYVQQLEAISDLPAEKITFRSDGAFIITGGLGGLGLASAAWVVEKGGRHLVLISRKQLPPQAEWAGLASNHPAYAIVQKLIALNQQGATTEIISADVTDIPALEKIFSGLETRQIPVRGMLHAAGVNWFSKVINLNHDRFLDTLKIKVSASWALHQLTANQDMDCFLLYSSVSALWGSVDLSHYTAANHFMDMLAQYRSSKGLPATSINWGPWAEAGMSAAISETAVLQKLGFHLLPPATALQAMETTLAARRTLSLVAAVDWNQFRPFIDFSLQPSLFEKVSTPPSGKATAPAGDLLPRLQQEPPEKAKQTIEEAVRRELRSVMLIESMDTIDAEQRFNFLGMDSLMAISLVGKLEAVFQCTLPNTLTYNYPTIRAVTDYIFELVYQPGNTVAANAAVPAEAVNETQPVTATSNGSYYRIIREATDAPAVTLYCFPFTGSGAAVFESWAALLPPHIQLAAIQLPGREERSDELPFTDMDSLVKAVVAAFEVPAQPYYFFGHSLGALIAYEVYAALKQTNIPLPEKLLLSGCNAPLKRDSKNIHQLPSAAFNEAILEQYGNSEKKEERKLALQQRELLLRADLQVLETYPGNQESIDLPLSIISGKHDTLATPGEVKKWAALCTEQFSVRFVNAGHDLLKEKRDELLQFISLEMEPAQKSFLNSGFNALIT